MISFKDLAYYTKPNQRIWLYQFSRNLSEDQINHIDQTLLEFVATWSSHGQPLNASHAILEGHYILISVDENVFEASGCSIDACTHVLQKMNAAYELDLFNRLTIGIYKLGQLQFYTKSQVQEQLAKGSLSSEDLFVDLSISKGSELAYLLKPIHQSWFYTTRNG